MHVNVTASLDSAFYADWYFGPHLQQAGYTVGIFGKHLNGERARCCCPQEVIYHSALSLSHPPIMNSRNIDIVLCRRQPSMPAAWRRPVVREWRG